MSLTFRYKTIERPDPLPPAVSPMIPVILKAKKRLDVLALLDSGADTTATKAKVILEEREDFPIIIGRMDFFESFNITFKENTRRIILKKA